ncbi:hypothetical protein FAVG1_10973 [Fusarium avenaceum]|nr:hypothetical protein FAVG1_10973 [Fusarium avenaceum]
MAELKNIYYINFVPHDFMRDRDSQSRFEAFKENVELNCQFINAKANITVKDKITSGELKNEPVAKAAYKARVVNHLLSSIPWMTETSASSESKRFDTDKSRFHQELVSAFTQGLDLPSSITSDVEGVLTEIKQTITAVNQSGNGANKLQFVIVLNVFSDMVGVWQSYTRAISFRPDDSLVTYIRNKNETTKVNLSIQYNHNNTQFDDRMFQAKAKESIQQIDSSLVDQALTSSNRVTDQQKIQESGAICGNNDNDHGIDEEVIVMVLCEDAQCHNSKQGSGNLSAIPSQPEPTTQQLSSDAFHHGTKAYSPSQRKRQRTASDDGSDEESNTDTAVKHNLQDPVRGYMSWLTKLSCEFQESINMIRGLGGVLLETTKQLETDFLTRQGNHEQEIETLQAELRAIQQDKQDNIAVRNFLQPIIQRQGSDCAEEWRAALDRCNKSLKPIEERRRSVKDRILYKKKGYDMRTVTYETKIREIGEQIEASAPELAQCERIKRVIHIMKTLV